MQNMTSETDPEETPISQIGEELKQGKIGIIPTDTQYGIVTSALKEDSIEKIYSLRKRNPEKPMIVLISDVSQIEDLGININPQQKQVLEKYWPNPLSIIIPVKNQELAYLHREKESLAFRMPQTDWLKKLLQISGPLVAPSANFEGEKPSSTIKEAQQYFQDQVDFYIDGGEMDNPPSTIIKLTDQGFEIIRQGAFRI